MPGRLLDEYRSFISNLITSRNSIRIERLEEEFKLLKPLPTKKYYAPVIIETKVSQFSTVRILKATYSVPSRLIGYSIRAYIYQGEIKLYYGQTLVQTMPQIKCGKNEAAINYRHIITSLLRKPGAFANYYYRDHLFPSSIFRTVYDGLIKAYPINGAKQYLQILQLAAIGSESEVSTALDILITNKVIPSYSEVQELINASKQQSPEVKIILPSLTEYDSLLTVAMRG